MPKCLQSRLLILVSVLLASSIAVSQSGRPHSRATSSPTKSSKPTVSINLAVIPFRQTVGSAETANLGQGIADSLTNALKSVSTLAVADVDALYKASTDEHLGDIATKDEDAIRLGRELGLAMLVVGSYQSVGDQLIIEARILNVAENGVLPNSAVSLNGRFPSDYPSMLTQLNSKILAALRIQPTLAETRNLRASSSSSSAEALAAYNFGLARMRQGTVSSLQESITSFERCLAADPGYASAYIAKAEAQTQLADLKKSQGEDDPALRQQAVSDAQIGVQKQPNLGRSHRALARAENGAGNYDQAAKAARRAVELSPNDAVARFDLSRALNHGDLVLDGTLEQLLSHQTWITLLFNDFPKVIARNNCAYPVTASFTSSDGKQYPKVDIQPSSAKVVALLAGSFQVDFDCDIGNLTRQYELKQGEVAELTFQCSDIVTAKVTLTNKGNAAAYVTFSREGRTKTFVVNPGEVQSRDLQAGHYIISCAAGQGSAVLKTREDNFQPNGEYTYSCSVMRHFEYRQR